MKKLKSLVVLALALTTFGLIGCSSNDATKESSETRVVETAKGEVEIPANPKKIVDISGSSEELVLLGHNVVGTSNVDSYDTSNVPAYMKDKLGDAKVVGHSMMETADVEAILACEPDLIIMSTRQEQIYDELKEIAKEIVRNDALDRVIIGLDFFDASINRIAAWTIGTRNMIKALLNAMLTPNELLRKLQDEGNFTERLALMEEFKTYPMGDIWNYYCEKNNVPVGESWIEDVKRYEEEVLSKRN